MRTFGQMKRVCVIISMLVVLLASCGHSDTFRVAGSIADGSSINIRFVYYTDGGIQTGLTASVDGKFEFEGRSPEMAAVEVYDNDYRLLGRFVAQNGEDIKLKIDRGNVYLGTASGNDFNKLLTEFYNTNAETLAKSDSPERNKFIADYVATHSGSPLAQLILATEIDASTEEGAALADSLMKGISPEARTIALAEPFVMLNSRVGSEAAHEPIAAITYKAAGNRTETFITQRTPLSVISVSDDGHGRDSVVEAIRKLAKYEKKGRLAVIDLSVDADTMIWRRSVKNDSATWKQGWAAGAISGQSLDKMGIPAVPYFILTDSAGTQLWRGRSATAIVSQTVSRLQNEKTE